MHLSSAFLWWINIFVQHGTFYASVAFSLYSLPIVLPPEVPSPWGRISPPIPKGVPVCCLSCVYFIFHLSANRNSFSWLALSPGIFLIPFFLCTLLCLLVAVKIVPFLPLTLEVASSPGLPDSPALDLNWKRIPSCISLVIRRSLNPDGLLLIRFWLEGYCFFLCFISLHWKTKQNKKTLQRFLVLLQLLKLPHWLFSFLLSRKDLFWRNLLVTLFVPGVEVGDGSLSLLVILSLICQTLRPTPTLKSANVLS